MTRHPFAPGIRFSSTKSEKAARSSGTQSLRQHGFTLLPLSISFPAAGPLVIFTPMKNCTCLNTDSHQWASLVLRLALAVIFFAHGGQKLFGWFGGYGLHGTAGFFANTLHMTPGLFWAILVGCGEFIGGILMFFGFLTRLAALDLVIIMLVAMHFMSGSFFMVKAGGIEFPLAVFAAALDLLISGGGALALAATLACRSGESEPAGPQA